MEGNATVFFEVSGQTKKDCTLFLFNDLLVIAQKKPSAVIKSDVKYTELAKVNLQSISLQQLDALASFSGTGNLNDLGHASLVAGSDNAPVAFRAVYPNGAVVVTFESPAECSRWQDEVVKNNARIKQEETTTQLNKIRAKARPLSNRLSKHMRTKSVENITLSPSSSLSSSSSSINKSSSSSVNQITNSWNIE